MRSPDHKEEVISVCSTPQFYPSYNFAENWMVAIYLGHFLGIDKAIGVQTNLNCKFLDGSGLDIFSIAEFIFKP
jgi:hypothetical protein